MANDIRELVKLAVDNYHGNVTKYSSDQATDVLRNALIEANGGSSVLDYRSMRDGKCGAVFTLIEEILSRTVPEGLQESDFFNTLVDYRNVAEGDQIVFRIEDGELFEVAEIARGTQGIRRQRIGGSKEITLKTKMYGVRIYEELSRVLSGRVDFNSLINKVAESYRQMLLENIYTMWNTVTADQMGGETYFPVAGSFDNDKFLTLIEHVEASAGGSPASIVCTRAASRTLNPAYVSTSSNAANDLYAKGVYATYYGTPLVITPQRHKVNSNDFLFDDKAIYVVAGSEKPIKCVREGNPLIIPGDPMTNADLTQEYFYEEAYGLGIVLAGNNASIGKWTLT